MIMLHTLTLLANLAQVMSYISTDFLAVEEGECVCLSVCMYVKMYEKFFMMNDWDAYFFIERCMKFHFLIQLNGYIFDKQ